jgi:hypothetical protein
VTGQDPHVTKQKSAEPDHMWQAVNHLHLFYARKFPICNNSTSTANLTTSAVQQGRDPLSEPFLFKIWCSEFPKRNNG